MKTSHQPQWFGVSQVNKWLCRYPTSVLTLMLTLMHTDIMPMMVLGDMNNYGHVMLPQDQWHHLHCSKRHGGQTLDCVGGGHIYIPPRLCSWPRDSWLRIFTIMSLPKCDLIFQFESPGLCLVWGRSSGSPTIPRTLWRLLL